MARRSRCTAHGPPAPGRNWKAPQRRVRQVRRASARALAALWGRSAWARRGHGDARFMQRREQFRTRNQYVKSSREGRHVAFQREVLLAVPACDEPAQVAIAFVVLDQTDHPALRARLADFGADDGHNAFLAARLQKWPQPVQIIGVGERDSPIPVLARSHRQMLRRRRAPHQ
jgi:hypothetical protein